jgi:hypothetical protein
MSISYVLITLHLQNQNFQRTPLTQSEADLTELSDHEYFKDALSTTVKNLSFFFLLQMIFQ